MTLVAVCVVGLGVALPPGIGAGPANAPPRADPEAYRACGVNALYLACQIRGIETNLAKVTALLPPAAEQGHSLAELEAAARALGFFPVAARLRLDQLQSLPPPVVLHVRRLPGVEEGDHYVLYLGRTGRGGVVVLDAPRVPTSIQPERLERLWAGHALVLGRTADEADALRLAWAAASRPWWSDPLLWTTGLLLLLGLAVSRVLLRSPRKVMGASMNFAKHAALPSLLLLALCGCGGSPRLVVESQALDFGVLAREEQSLEIPITNQGNRTLAVRKVSTSCACTLGEAPRAIPPGETAKVVIKTPRLNAGPGSTRVTIESNDPAGPHEFYLSWFGQSPPRLDPPSLALRHAAPGSVYEREVQISYAGGDDRRPLVVGKVAVSDPRFSLTQVRSEPVAKQSTVITRNLHAVTGEVTFLFRCRLPNEPGVVAGRCDITVTQAGQALVLSLPVELHVDGPLAATPSSAVFTAGTQEGLVGKKMSVAVRVTGPEEPAVVEAPDLLRCTLSGGGAEQQPRRYVLLLEVVKAPTAAPLKTAVVLQLGADKSKRVTIPVELFAVNR